MYITPLTLLEYDLELGKIESNSRALADIISDDQSSKDKIEMAEGVKYFKGEHQILDRKIEYIIDDVITEDKTKANNKLVNNFHKVLVVQKTGYILSAPIKFTTEDKEYQKVLNKELGDWFTDICDQWIEGASNKGVEYLHPYIDEQGKLDYVILPAEQIIPIYDSTYQNRLLAFIRYYEIEDFTDNVKNTTTKIEVWDDKEVTYYIKVNGIFALDPNEEINPRAHYYEFNTNTPDNKIPKNWGKPPLIELDNNNLKQSDLTLVKTLIDAYNLGLSDFANNLEDIQELIFNLKEFDGTDLKEFLKNLKVFKVIKTSGDGGVETIKVEVPAEAREKFLKICERNIYIFGMGFNPTDEQFGSNSSGVALNFKYTLLDIKANKLINKLKRSLKEFIYFLTVFINQRDKKKYDYENVQFTITKAMIINEDEKITEAKNSKGIIPDKIIMQNHPWVKDPEEAMKLLDEQETASLERVTNSLGNTNADQLK